MIQETSLKAYLEEKENFKTQELKVLEYIKHNPLCCDLEISNKLNININAINGRRNSLTKKGLIISELKLRSPYTNKLVNVWVVKNGTFANN